MFDIIMTLLAILFSLFGVAFLALILAGTILRGVILKTANVILSLVKK